MRRQVGYVLAGLGTVLIVIAVVLPTYIAPSVIKWPLNKYRAVTLTAANASYFNAQKLSVVSGVTIEANYTFQGDGAKGTPSTAVWNEFNYVHDVTNNVQIQLGTRTFAFDRKTAELVNCCGASVNGNPNVHQTGIVGYAFPIGTKQQTYLVYDVTAGKAEPFRYSGTATVGGIQTYKFHENVAPTPATGEPVSSNYQNDVVYYVDPETGIPLKITEHEIVTQQSPVVTLFDASLATTSASISELVSQDNTSRQQISLLRTTLPLGSGILGVVLLIIGVFLGRPGPRDEVAAVPSAPDPATRVAAAQDDLPAAAPGAMSDAPSGAVPAATRDDLPAAQDAAHSWADGTGNGTVQGLNGRANSGGIWPNSSSSQSPAADREAKPDSE